MSVDISKRMAVNSIYSIFLESRNPEEISFHHVLQRLNVLIQDRLAYALFKKNEDGIYGMFYPFLNDPIAAKRIAAFYGDKFGRSGEADYRNPENNLFQILDTEYYLLCIQIVPIEGGDGKRFEFVNLKAREDDESIRERIKDDLNKIKEGEVKSLNLSHKDKEVIIRYVLSKIFCDDETESERKTGNDKISDNFPKYKNYIEKSISVLEGRKYSCSITGEAGIEKYRWHQDICFKSENLNKLNKIEWQSIIR